jgi:hypothetical protein
MLEDPYSLLFSHIGFFSSTLASLRSTLLYYSLISRITFEVDNDVSEDVLTFLEMFTPVRQYERFTNRALRLINRPSD